MNRSFDESQSPLKNENKMMTTNNDFFSGKNLVIVILTGLLVLSFLGINLLIILGDFMQVIINIFTPLISQILSVFGYTTGTILDKTEDVASAFAKTGIDIAGGTVDSLADLLKRGSEKNVDPAAKNQLDTTLNTKNDLNLGQFIRNEPKADISETPIQKPITSDKSKWCLVGEYQGKRGCVEVNDASKCLSGQVFPNLQMCLNPTKGVLMHSQAA